MRTNAASKEPKLVPDFHSSQEELPSTHGVPLSSTAICASRICLQALVLASTSRFISQGPFTVYKGVLSLYFLFWCVRWPLADFDSIFLFVTYWAWYAGALCECRVMRCLVCTRKLCMSVHCLHHSSSAHRTRYSRPRFKDSS